MLQFTLTRSALHPIFRSKLATPAGMARDPHIAAVLELLLYKAYKKELQHTDRPAIEIPPSSTEVNFSVAQKQSLYNIAGFMLSATIKRYVDRGSTDRFSSWVESFTNRMNLGKSAAAGQNLPIGKVEHNDLGGLIYPHHAFFAFVLELERVYAHNLGQKFVDAYGTSLLNRISTLIESTGSFYDGLCSRVLPLLEPKHRDAFPKEVYEFLIEKFERMRRKDHAKNRNALHDDHRRLDATAGTTALRPALSAISAQAAAKRKAGDSRAP